MTVVQNPSNIFTNFNSNNTANGTRTNNWQNTTKPNNLQRTPKKDEFQKGNSDSNKKQKNILIGAGVALVAAAGLLFGHKLYKSNQIANALEKIEQKFVTLQDNMPEVQKTFKEVFLRGDISEKEAREMLNRYKEIEKLGVTGTKEEYIQAIFEEAKRNFGFKDSKFRLSLEKGKVSKNGKKTAGGAAQLCTRIMVDPSSQIEQIQGIIHHEMRHMKQNYYAVNFDPQGYKYALRSDSDVKLSEEVRDDCMLDIKNMFNLKAFSRNNIPAEQINYAEKCLEGSKSYVDGHKNFAAYYNNFKEVDARYAGGLIDKLFYGAVLGGNK